MQRELNTQSIKNYDIIKKVGSGSFGTVFLVRRKQTSRLFALKRLNKQHLINNKMKKYAYAQRQILKEVDHPFILHGESFFQDSLYVYLIMQFAQGGDLQKVIRKNVMDQKNVKNYARQVILALQYLHKKGYLFRDLKVSNVLIQQSGHIKLADFGLAKHSNISDSFLGSIAYLAPQMLVASQLKPHGFQLDWYLLGVFIYQLINGLPPFYNQNRAVMFQNIKKIKPKIPQNISDQLKDFLVNILQKNPKKRLGYKGADQVKNHPWLFDTDWQIVLQKKLQLPKPQIDKKTLRQRESITNDDMRFLPKQQGYWLGWDYFNPT